MKNNLIKFMRLLLSRQYFPPFMTVLMLLIGSLAVFSLVTDEQLTIEKDQIVARIEPATNSESIATLEKGKSYDILSKANGWYKVRLDARSDGWVPEWFIESETLTSDHAIAAHILVDTPVYTETNEKSAVMTTIQPENYLIVRFEKKGWLQVEVDGRYGYIKTRAVNLINLSDVPSIDPDKLDEVYDPVAIQKAKDAAEKVVVVRYSGEPLFDAPSLNANRIYDIAYGQKFKYIDEVVSADGNEKEFILVEDSDGLQGYVESRIAGMEADSIGHVTEKTAQSLQDAVIMIDPGHGGEEAGATTEDESVYEKNITLSTSLLLKQKLEAVGAKVLMTRETDEFIDLIPRSDLSNEQQVDAFISIHFDKGQVGWSGSTTYYFHEDDYELAKTINDAISTLALPNNGTLFGNYSVLRENTRPAVLLEIGYMSNAIDIQYITSADYQEAVTNVIVTALEEYFDK